jgi:hypothetical protein
MIKTEFVLFILEVAMLLFVVVSMFVLTWVAFAMDAGL